MDYLVTAGGSVSNVAVATSQVQREDGSVCSGSAHGIPAMPDARRAAGSVVIDSKKIYVAGGVVSECGIWLWCPRV